MHTCRMINLAYRNDHEIKQMFASKLILLLKMNVPRYFSVIFVQHYSLLPNFDSAVDCILLRGYPVQLKPYLSSFAFPFSCKKVFDYVTLTGEFLSISNIEEKPLQLHYGRCPRWTCAVFSFAPHLYPLGSNASFGKSFSPFYESW